MKDHEPKSKDPEILAFERTAKELRELAKTLPVDTEMSGGGSETRQFGNNFYFLFLAIQSGEMRAEPMLQTYIEKAEKYGEKWQKFLTENKDLLDNIKKIMSDVIVINKINTEILAFLFKPNTKDLAEQLSLDLKVKNIKIAIWKKLNPLLQEASEKMETCGMNPREFGFTEGEDY